MRLTILLLIIAGLARGQGEPAPSGVTPRRMVDALPEKLLDLTAEGFRTRDTPHFVIRYNVADELLEPLIAPLEETYAAAARFAKEFGAAEPRPAEPLSVLFFEGFDDYAKCAQRVGVGANAAAGFYDRATNVSVFFNIVNSPLLREVRESIAKIESKLQRTQRFTVAGQERMLRAQLAELTNRRDELVQHYNRFVLRHEVAHQVLFNLGVHRRDGHNPAWLTEGLACQFEEPRPGAQTQLPVNQARLADVREALGVGAGAVDDVRAALAEAIAKGKWEPLPHFVTSDAAFAETGDRSTQRYAQAWALVHYLCNRKPDEFRKYLRSVAARPGDKAMTASEALGAFESAFGAITAETDFRFVDSVLRLPFVEPKVEE